MTKNPTLPPDSIDAEIERILADDTPVTEADHASILECNLGIAKGRNAMLAKALQSSLDIMRSYQRMGYGDDVYMSTLCQAVRDAERALALHVVETLPPQPNVAPADIYKILKHQSDSGRLGNDYLSQIARDIAALYKQALPPSQILEGKAEAFDQIVAARKKYVEAAKTYNARRDLANAERMRGSWAIKLDTEYRAMSDAQTEYHRTVQGLADAAIATSEGSE